MSNIKLRYITLQPMNGKNNWTESKIWLRKESDCIHQQNCFSFITVPTVWPSLFINLYAHYNTLVHTNDFWQRPNYSNSLHRLYDLLTVCDFADPRKYVSQYAVIELLQPNVARHERRDQGHPAHNLQAAADL